MVVVVDGDLCEMFPVISVPRQKAVANELDRTVEEVRKKLEQLRTTASGF